MAYRVVTVIILVRHLVSLVQMPHAPNELTILEHSFAAGSARLRNMVLERLILAGFMIFRI